MLGKHVGGRGRGWGLLLIALWLDPIRPAVASDCMQWVRREDVGSPGSQHRHCMAFAEARGTVVLYSADESSDLWEYDGRGWRRVEVTGTRPPARLDAGLTATRGTSDGGVLLVAGYSRIPLNGDEHRLADVWHFIFDGPFTEGAASRGHWVRQGEISRAATPAQTPQVTTRHFEQGPRANVRVVTGPEGPLVFGGLPQVRILSPGGAVDATFEGPAHFVHRLELNGSVGTYVGALAATEMAVAFDTRRKRVLQYGGVRHLHHDRAPYVGMDSDLRDFLAKPGLQFITNLPPRLGHRMVYDPRRDRLVVFGGGTLTDGGTSPSKWSSQLVDARRFFEVELGGNTLQEPVTDVIPAARWGHDMVYDSRRGVVVLCGGWNGITSTLDSMPRETWEYRVRLFEFLEQPQKNQSVCAGGTFEVSVRVLSHATPRYQWYIGNHTIPGETNRTLVRAAVTRRDEGVYRCEATDACGNQIVSATSTVTVHLPPAGLGGAGSMAVCPGERAFATFNAVSALPMTVTWFRVEPDADGNPSADSLVRVPSAADLGIPDKSQQDLELPAMQPSENGFYRARAVNACGETWSDVGMLTAGAWIRAHPRSVTNRVCTPQSLRVVAAGKGELKYRWRRNGLPLESDARVVGAEGPVLLFTTLRYLDDGSYDCVVSDTCTTVTSRVAQVTVEPNPPFVLVETNGPAARMRHAMVFDSVRGVTVLFGGIGSGGTLSEAYRNDTWEYDGQGWTRRLTSRVPSGRTDFGMAFDRNRGRVVLFGGFTHDGINGNLRNGETWEYDGRDWTLRTPTNAPSPRANPTLFYDPVRKVTTLYGGDSSDPLNPRAGDIWAWDGTNWVQRVVEGERPQFGSSGSPARPQMVWDDARGYAVLPPTALGSGGGDRATWLWDGSRWSKRAYTFGGFGVTPAIAGSGMGMVYDSYRREVVYWGGDGTDQTWLWRWTGESWRRDDISEAVGFELNTAAAYDSRRGSIVQFGGQYSGPDIASRGLSARSWERVLADAPVILREPVVHRPAPPGRLLVQLVAAGAGPVVYEWQRDQVPLAEGGLYTGTKTATLSVDPSLVADAGSYRCIVRTPCAEVASLPVRLGGGGAGLALAAASQLNEGGQSILRLSWDAPGALLEQAAQLGGPWQPVPNAKSPFLAPLDSPSAYFRIRVP